MPEGDSIHRLARRIAEHFAGQTVQRCTTRDPRLVGLQLSGSTLVAAEAIGKHLLLQFSNRVTIRVHLRMDGSVVVGPASPAPAWRRRLELWFDSGRLTAVDVPELEVLRPAAEHTLRNALGPDVLTDPPPDPALLAQRVQLQGPTPLAAALLDQRVVAGFGNVFAVELPFIAGVSPNQPAGSIDGLHLMLAAGTSLIRDSAERGPRNTTGRNLQRADHWIYGRRRCPLCGTALDGWTDQTSPWRRRSVWCPHCQPSQERCVVDAARIDRLLALHPAWRVQRSTE